MRLADTRILEGLTHPDVFVRDVVLDYLEKCRQTRPGVTARVVEHDRRCLPRCLRSVLRSRTLASRLCSALWRWSLLRTRASVLAAAALRGCLTTVTVTGEPGLIFSSITHSLRWFAGSQTPTTRSISSGGVPMSATTTRPR